MSSRPSSPSPSGPVGAENSDGHGPDSESDDHFSDAQSAPAESSSASSVLKTEAEETGDDPSHEAAPRTRPSSDAMPDMGPKVDGTSGSNMTDATVVESLPLSVSSSKDDMIQEPRSESTAADATAPDGAGQANEEPDDDFGDDFGDDFDEFEEGGAGDDDDFGDFDDGFVAPSAEVPAPPPQSDQQPAPVAPTAPPAAPALSFPIPDFEGLDADEVLQVAAPYLSGLYEPDTAAVPAPPPLANALFLTPRSASLWSQLVAPPPLQPPDWIRSRIRRLFLVSLGVPVDLDEILPASKQKKLILPSLSVHRGDSPRTSSDSRSNTARDGPSPAANHSVTRLKQGGANGSNSSVDSQGNNRPSASSSSRKRRGPPPPPDLDLVAAQQLCATTDAALDGMTDDELQVHVKRLKALEGAAGGVLEYWTKRTDEKIGDREAFEGVIESLVAHARKTRK